MRPYWSDRDCHRDQWERITEDTSYCIVTADTLLFARVLEEQTRHPPVIIDDPSDVPLELDVTTMRYFTSVIRDCFDFASAAV
jgi:hypothetical protein